MTDPYLCTACGSTTWDLRLFPDDGHASLAPRDVIGVWCATCGERASSTHPLRPQEEEETAWTSRTFVGEETP